MYVSQLIAVGHYVPERRLTNLDLEKMVETNDEWIVQRTGIKERRIAADDEFTSDLCIKAVQNLRERYPSALEGVDHIVVATMTADNYCPNVSSQVQAHFGISDCGATDLNSACSGFVYGLTVAHGLICSGFNQKVLVIGADAMSKIVDFKDRTTCILFGDGAGAAILESAPTSDFLVSYTSTQGELASNLYCTGLSETIGPNRRVITQNGREVFKWAVSSVRKGVGLILEKAKMDASQLDWFIPHSANQRILDAVCEKLGIPSDKVCSALPYSGNTSAASIGIALSEGVLDQKIQQGQTLCLYGFGGGLTQSGLVCRLHQLN
ncbi:MAG: ketoacyl-ACP synthase III [Actinobacteria bacterium]|nr:ketoacyl-ACP synthase III [Actinomycetota bacterium]